MVWYGMVWYGMVWYGLLPRQTILLLQRPQQIRIQQVSMVWYGMVWYGLLPRQTILTSATSPADSASASGLGVVYGHFIFVCEANLQVQMFHNSQLQSRKQMNDDLVTS